MARTRAYGLAMRLSEQIVAKSENLLDRTGLFKDARIARDPRHGAQRQRGQAELRVSQDDPMEPWLQTEWRTEPARKA